MALEILMSEILAFLDWEKRPAVITIIGDAYAVVSENGDWEKTDRTEVIDNSRIISAEAFSTLFPYADLSTIPPNSERPFQSFVNLAAGFLEYANELTLFDWEGKPAALFGWNKVYAFPATLMGWNEAYAIETDGGVWNKVNDTAGFYSGKIISEEDFSKLFPNADLSAIPPSTFPPPTVWLAAALTKMTEEIILLDWESRPAVQIKGGRAYAIVSKDGSWKEVISAEVSDSGHLISAKEFFRVFPNADISKIPGIPDRDAKLAASDATITLPSPVDLSSPKSKAHSRPELSHTDKASEVRWLREAVLRMGEERKPVRGGLP
jgi:hypothetical protein